jgi:hypothetical protein
VDVMIKTVGDRMMVKPSGGIRMGNAVAFLVQGADRLGVGSTEAVLKGGKSRRKLLKLPVDLNELGFLKNSCHIYIFHNSN